MTMNLRASSLSLAGAVLVVFSSLASAQAPAAPASAAMPRVDARQERQETRIDKGVASGQLTPRETRRLEREQKAVAGAEANAKADGTVTPQERRRLAHMQNGASRDIHRQKHDAQAVPPAK
jgi:hypothetical protein